jgi:hypothetical protein
MLVRDLTSAEKPNVLPKQLLLFSNIHIMAVLPLLHSKSLCYMGEKTYLHPDAFGSCLLREVNVISRGKCGKGVAALPSVLVSSIPNIVLDLSPNGVFQFLSSEMFRDCSTR